MKKLAIGLLLLGLLSLVSVFLIRQKMETARNQIELISEDLSGLPPGQTQYESLMAERIPYLEQIESLDLYSKVLLGVGGLFFVGGVALIIITRRK